MKQSIWIAIVVLVGCRNVQKSNIIPLSDGMKRMAAGDTSVHFVAPNVIASDEISDGNPTSTPGMIESSENNKLHKTIDSLKKVIDSLKRRPKNIHIDHVDVLNQN